VVGGGRQGWEVAGSGRTYHYTPYSHYVRLVRTNGNAGPSGDVLYICLHLISRSSPFESQPQMLHLLRNWFSGAWPKEARFSKRLDPILSV
jgi:hypothetical protein